MKKRAKNTCTEIKSASSSVLKELFSSLGKDNRIKKEVLALVHENGFDPDRLTLNELRSIVAAYARRIILRQTGS